MGVSYGFNTGLTTEGAGPSWGAGVSGSVSAGFSEGESEATRHLRTQVTGRTVDLEVGGDAALIGAVVAGERVRAEIGGDLEVVTVADLASSRNRSLGGSLGLSMGLGGGPVSSGLGVSFGEGERDSAWIDRQAGFQGTDVAVEVEGHTRLEGGSIAGDLTTGSLSWSDLEGHDRGRQVDLSLNGSLPVNGGGSGDGLLPELVPTGEGGFASQEREQVARATVTGEVTVTDPDAQAQEQAQDLAALNRDPDRALEVTKDERTSFDVYLSPEAVNEVNAWFDSRQDSRLAIGAANLAEGLEALVEDFVGELSEDPAEAALITQDAARLREGQVTLEELAREYAVFACQSFNLFDLFIGRAYASGGSCTAADQLLAKVTATELLQAATDARLTLERDRTEGLVALQKLRQGYDLTADDLEQLQPLLNSVAALMEASKPDPTTGRVALSGAAEAMASFTVSFDDGYSLRRLLQVAGETGALPNLAPPGGYATWKDYEREKGTEAVAFELAGLLVGGPVVGAGAKFVTTQAGKVFRVLVGKLPEDAVARLGFKPGNPDWVGPGVSASGRPIEFDGQFYSADGFRIKKDYYDRLWGISDGSRPPGGRPAPFLQARSILDSNPKVTLDPKGAPGFFRYEAAGLEMIYNPNTGRLLHIAPVR